MTQYNHPLNRDLGGVQTPAEYNEAKQQWEMPVKGTVQLSGSTVDLRGKSADKPSASAVDVGTTYWSVDTDPRAESIEVSNGTTWVVI